MENKRIALVLAGGKDLRKCGIDYLDNHYLGDSIVLLHNANMPLVATINIEDYKTYNFGIKGKK